MAFIHRCQFWLFGIFFLLAFAAAAAALGLSVSAEDAVFVLLAYAGIFLLAAGFYLSPAYPSLNRRGGLRMIVPILLLVVPAALLHAWLAFVRDYRVAPLAWMAAFMGLGVGINIRAMREKGTS